jgi:hypothetical protein
MFSRDAIRRRSQIITISMVLLLSISKFVIFQDLLVWSDDLWELSNAADFKLKGASSPGTRVFCSALLFDF